MELCLFTKSITWFRSRPRYSNERRYVRALFTFCRKNMSVTETDPPFRAMVRASGLGEVWTHSTESSKFNQFGWRCTNKENSFSNDTLIGNWNEERFDNNISRQAQRIPGQHEHYFQSTYGVGYNKSPPYEVPKELIHLKERHSHAFPGHQPEIDNGRLKSVYNSWETTTRSSYVDPKIRQQPLQNPTS